MEFGVISPEERTRHEALFFSQGPIDGLLPGDKSRELFLQSKLPLTVLSQVWNLVDIPHDNMLEVSEFVLAMHLLQWHMRGRRITREITALPQEMRLPQRLQPRLPPITVRELRACKALFAALGAKAKGHLDGHLARDVLATSGLCRMQLALVWNLADVDRDSCLTFDEFAVACHLVRLFKKGEVITGPINVQSLLPHHLPKTDLAAKQTRVQYLEQMKHKLMALKERRKREEIREEQRADLWTQRFELLHELLKGDSSESDERHYSLLSRVAQRSDRTATVAHRLKRDHEQIRQETARVIIEEQKLSHEVKILKETASTIRAKQKRNSIIKDLDPFHELYEIQKEEKQRGVSSTRPSPSPSDIPHKVHPFHMDRMMQSPLSGQALFGCESSDECAKCEQCQRLSGEEDTVCVDCPPEQGVHGPWQNREEDKKLLEMTHSFEDNFVDVWCKAPSDPESPSPVSMLRGISLDREFCFVEEEDPVFRTVSVTAEEDDLWKGIPGDLPQLLQSNNNVEESNDVFLIHEHLLQNSQELLELMESGPTTVFKKEEDYEKQERGGGGPPRKESFLSKLKIPHKLPAKIRSPFSRRKPKTGEVTPSDNTTTTTQRNTHLHHYSPEAAPVAPRRTKAKGSKNSTISALVAAQARIDVPPYYRADLNPPADRIISSTISSPPVHEQDSVSSSTEFTGSLASTSSADLDSLADSQDSQPTPPPRKARKSQKVRLKDTKKKFQTVDGDQLSTSASSRKPSSPTKAFSLPQTQSDSVCESFEFPHHDQLKRSSEFGNFSKQSEPYASAAVVEDHAFENVSFSEEDQSLGDLNRCIDSLDNLSVTVSIAEKTHLDSDLIDDDDDDDMDAESRKQELEKMRLRFFDKRNAAADSAATTTSVTSPLLDLYPTSTQNIDFDSDGFYEDHSKSILNTDHKTTITISRPEDRHGMQSARDMFDPMDIVQPELQQLQRNRRYDPQSEDEDELVIGASPPAQFAQQPTNKSKIVLDLDDFQYRPEFNSRPHANEESFSGGNDGMDFIFGSEETPRYDGPPTPRHDAATTDLLGMYPQPQPSRVLLDLNDDTPDPREILIDDTAPPPAETTTSLRGTSRGRANARAVRSSEVDSDLSDNEGTFQATFVPAAGVVEASDSEQDDSGIVLLSYSHDKVKQEDCGVNLLHSRPLANATDYPVNNQAPPPLPRSQPPLLITADNENTFSTTTPVSSAADFASKHSSDSDFNLPSAASTAAAPTPRPYSLRTADASAQNKMDAKTGLRKTGPLSPVDKAVDFVSRTEPSYRVKPKEEVAMISKELQHNRQEILDISRVRARKVDSWVPGTPWPDDSSVGGGGGGGGGEPPELPKQAPPPVPQPEIRAKITESELKYDERKKLNRQKLEKLLLPPPTVLVAAPLEVDTSSVGDQDLTKRQHWDEHHSDDDHLDQRSRSPNQNESAIEREIRLARERELELKFAREQQQIQQPSNNNSNLTMPIYKVPPQLQTTTRKTELPSSPQVDEQPKQMYKELTEVDRDSEMLQRESIIEREIREQNEREQALRQKTTQDKEFEQSELERREKEQESAQHESLVEREIRLQLHREAEIDHRRPHEAMTSPSPPQTGHRPDQSVSYAHAGESLIARELREQKEREEELRSRWNAMGMDMPPVSDEPETPFQMPQPTVQQAFVHSAAANGGSSSSNGLHPTEDAPVKPPSPQPQTSIEGRSKVRPFEDPDESDQTPAFERYAPQNETPIDREIRMMKEREEALRESRGLPIYATTNDVSVEISPSRPQHLHRKGEEEVGRGAMKRLAHSNIQKEIAREQQKETDLQQLGRIKTLSMDQTHRQPKYTEVLSKEQLSGPPPSMRTPVQPKSPGFYAPTTPAAMHKTVYSPEIRAAASPVNNSHVNGRGAPVVNRYTPTSQGDETKTGRATTESKIDLELKELREREEELKAQRRMLTHVQPPAPPGQSESSDVAPLTPTSPKMPLDSLELLHRHSESHGPAATAVAAHSPSSPVQVTPSAQHAAGGQGLFTVRDSSSNAFPGDKSVKSARRKSALASEWERKFGGGAN